MINMISKLYIINSIFIYFHYVNVLILFFLFDLRHLFSHMRDSKIVSFSQPQEMNTIFPAKFSPKRYHNLRPKGKFCFKTIL